MEYITVKQLEKLAEEKTLLTGTTSCPWDPRRGKTVIGILHKVTFKDEGDVCTRYTLQYRLMKEGTSNLVQGHKLNSEFASFWLSDGKYIHQRKLENLTYWSLEPVRSKTLIDAWDAAENRHNTRKEQVKDFKKPFEEIVSEVKENALTLIPEISLGQEHVFFKEARIIAGRKLIRLAYFDGPNHIGLESLVNVKNFVKEAASRRGISFRASRIGSQKGFVMHEFFFD